MTSIVNDFQGAPPPAGAPTVPSEGMDHEEKELIKEMEGIENEEAHKAAEKLEGQLHVVIQHFARKMGEMPVPIEPLTEEDISKGWAIVQDLHDGRADWTDSQAAMLGMMKVSGVLCSVVLCSGVMCSVVLCGTV
jgi:hypothetical protein